MKLVVGLGNPGERYKNTRHNIGANVAKKFAKLHNISLRRQRYLSHFGEGKVGGEDVKIILPLTYMNLSGEAVGSIVKDKKIALSSILVICDDADLELDTLRLRPKGSSGGHKGLRSIIEHLKSDSFPRLRIGIGKAGDLKDHVLSPFGKSEADLVEGIEAMASEAVVCWITKGIEKAMSTYNAGRSA
ncbi:MAG: aminoacyl-tRNA hydrolase [Candidatus Omnitrophica bacterium]|nr:aminoacyl-tRNA hydrolase [Candidatus Omnitrophota bacterium]